MRIELIQNAPVSLLQEFRQIDKSIIPIQNFSFGSIIFWTLYASLDSTDSAV